MLQGRSDAWPSSLLLILGRVMSLVGSWGPVGPACDTRSCGSDQRSMRTQACSDAPIQLPGPVALRQPLLPRSRNLEGDKGQPCSEPATQAAGEDGCLGAVCVTEHVDRDRGAKCDCVRCQMCRTNKYLTLGI